jgi:prophage antirepressor-like protein
MEPKINSMEVVQSIEKHFYGHVIRIGGTADEPLFCARDLAQILQIKYIQKTIAVFDPHEKSFMKLPTNSGVQECLALSEHGIYRLLYTTRSPIGKQFRGWVVQLIREFRMNRKTDIMRSIDCSERLVEKFQDAMCFYIIKVGDLPNNEQVYKIGQTNSNLKQRLNCHTRDYKHLNPREGRATLFEAWQCLNPLAVERAVKTKVFPDHKFVDVNPETGREAAELVLVNKYFTLSDLISVVEDCIEENKFKGDENTRLKLKLEAALEIIHELTKKREAESKISK